MARTPSHTQQEIIDLLGPRGSLSVNSGNRALVQKFLTASGVPAIKAKALSVFELGAVYNDASDAELNKLIDGGDTPEKPKAPYNNGLKVGDECVVNCVQNPHGTIWQGYRVIIARIDGEIIQAYRVNYPGEETRLFTAINLDKIKEEKPMVAPTPVMPESEVTQALLVLAQALSKKPESSPISTLDEARVKELINEHISKPMVIKLADRPEVKLPEGELIHQDFKKILTALTCGNVALIGPAGSGKTTISEICAKALNVPFYFTGAISSEYKLTGFIDAHGKYIRTAFREAFEHGGVFLFDEIDASSPGAVLAFNAALANGYADFPDKGIPKHKDFYCIAAANTFWTGADRVYVGRNQLDGATLDRFIFIELGYDENLERRLSGNSRWVDYVQRVRRKAKELKLRHVISPRASIMGSKLLAQGVHYKDVQNMVLFKGLDADTVSKFSTVEY
ncbi:MAG: AAA family ATPase [Patescibacteria group bacterium]|nr:AAA family ATPase [Patescibacteria group bacterium]